MPGLSQILISLISTFIFIPINALVLWAAARIFELKNSKFLTALKTAAAAAIVLFAAQQVIGAFSGAALTPTASSGAILATAVLVFAATIAITIAVNSYAVKLFYKEKIGKAFLVGAVWSVAMMIIGLVIGVIIVGLAAALIIGKGAAGGLA